MTMIPIGAADGAPVKLSAAMANRHGLIAGATWQPVGLEQSSRARWESERRFSGF
jgi:hypothetical protein